MRAIKIFISLLLGFTIFYSILGLRYRPYLIIDSLDPCCENFQCNTKPCSDSTGVNHLLYNCNHTVVTCKECMNLWRWGYICNVDTNIYNYCVDGSYKYSSWCGYELPLGISITGSHYASPGVRAYFSTDKSGGCPSHYPFHYQWKINIICDGDRADIQDPIIDSYPCGTWINTGFDSPDYSYVSDRDYILKCTLTDYYSVNSPITSSEWYVYMMEK